MGIPSAAAPAIDLDEADASLNQAPGQQAVGAESLRDLVVHPIELARGFGLFGEIDGFRCGGLHPIGEFVAVGACLEIGVVALVGPEMPVEVADEIEIAAFLPRAN